MEQQVFGGEQPASARPKRPVWEAMKRGALGRCPRCGEGRLFQSFVKTVDACEFCGERIDHHRADDLPAYLVVLVVGHIIVGGFMAMEAITTLSMWVHLAIWVPATILSALLLLRPTKGAVVGLQWALYMHGFGEEEEHLDTHPELQ